MNKAKVKIDIPPAPEGGYFVEQAARLLGVSRPTVERLALRGLLEMTDKRPGFRRRITEKSLRKFLEQQ